jgi:hypothetical protein
MLFREAASSVPTAWAAVIAAAAAISVGALSFLGQTLALRQQREHLDRQLGEQRAGHLTERFTRAIEQLGSDKPAVRLGGIYALGQIAKASQLDRGDIYEVLTAFVQVHARWPPRHRNHQPAEDHPRDDLPELWVWAPDVQAAMNVLARRSLEPPDGAGLEPPDGADRLRLVAVDLRRAALRGANLQRANLREACLQRAVLEGAHLAEAIFFGTRLEGANLKRVDLRKADLRGANLYDVNLREADLREAKLQDADLRKADLRGANLHDVDLREADLRDANLPDADLRKAR